MEAVRLPEPVQNQDGIVHLKVAHIEALVVSAAPTTSDNSH
jgi:hypothetical protein